MNINIQVDKSLFSNAQSASLPPIDSRQTGALPLGGAQVNRSAVGGAPAIVVAGTANTSSNEQLNNGAGGGGGGGLTFTNILNGVTPSANVNSSNAGGGNGTPVAGAMLTINSGPGLPLISQRSSGAGGTGSGNSGNGGGGPSGQTNNNNQLTNGLDLGGLVNSLGGGGQSREQFSVNVTITKVGNNLIQSRVDISNISKQALLPEEMEGGSQDELKRHSEHSRSQPQIALALPPIEQQSGPNSARKSDQEIENLRKQMEAAVDEKEEKIHDKFKKYDKRSLFLFSNRLRCRQNIIRLIRWKYYDYFMILSIAGNSICLAMNDYSDEENITRWNQRLDHVDKGFTVVYATEAVLKIIAFGFIMHRKSYMRDPWNVLDFLVVIIGLISLIPQVPNLKSLRTMRVLRPLRSINAVPSMKRLVKTLLLSLPQMGYLVSFLIFFISVFAILGMQMFTRDLYKRCRLTPEPILNNTLWPIDPTQNRLCGGFYECNPGTYCHGLIERQMPLEIDRVEDWDFIQYGFFHFDNIGVSILSIFRVITLEGWTPVMYNYMDASGFIAGIYFPVLVILGSFFLLNLFLAVIMETFSVMTERQRMKDLEKQTEKLSKQITAGKTVDEIKLDGQVFSKATDKEIEAMMKVTRKKLDIKKGSVQGLGDLTALMMYMKLEKQQSNNSHSQTNNQGRSSMASFDIRSGPTANPALQYDQDQAPFRPQPIEEEDLSEDFEEDDLSDHFRGSSPLSKTHGRSDASKRLDLANTMAGTGNGLRLGNSSVRVQNQAIDGFDDDHDLNSAKALNDNPQNHCDEITTPFEATTTIPNAQETLKEKFFSWICFQHVMFVICDSALFTYVINLSIILNTICLGLDGYPNNEQLQDKLDITNVFFFALFFLEMIIKIIGMTPNRYIKDNYNIFDAFIVTLSIVDVCLSYSLLINGIDSGRGAISAFRAFRLLRVFKLAKSWAQLKQLIGTILKSLQDISSFSVLLFLLMFIYILLGMEIFAPRDFPDAVQQQPTLQEKIQALEQRANFNNFFNGLIVIFTVLTGENWDDTMFKFAKQKGYIAIFFFISLQIIGVMIFLNLFLAILLENFDIKEEETEENQSELKKYIVEFLLRIKSKVKQCFKKLYNNHAVEINDIVDKNSSSNELNVADQSNASCDKKEKEPSDEKNETSSILQLRRVPLVKIEVDDNDLSDSISARDMQSNEEHASSNFPFRKMITKISNLEEIKEHHEEDHSPGRASGNISGAITQANSGFPGFANMNLFRRQQTYGVQTSVLERYQVTSNFGGNDHYSEAMMNDMDSNMVVMGAGAGKTADAHMIKTLRSVEFDNSPEDVHTNKSERKGFQDTNSRMFRGSYSKNMNPSKLDVVSVNTSPNSRYSRNRGLPKSFYLRMSEASNNHKLQNEDDLSKSLVIGSQQLCDGNSLIIFGSNSRIRLLFCKLVKSRYFEMFILILIAVSSVLLALDNPLNDPDSTLVRFLQIADFVLTAFFALESISKIVAQGFLLNGENSYLRNGWNVIDFAVVVVSIISLAITSNKLKIVKILRLLRVLRPLRVISRNKGLKIGIQALFMAIPNIINVIIVSMLFFLIFGIIGVNYFKGAFYSCTFGQHFPEQMLYDKDILVRTKFDCLNYGGAWVNADQNFDNVPQAMSTLFQMATTEGWIDMMNRGIDAVGIDMEPFRNQNIYWAFFFMLFIVLGNFLILNLFVGVVVSTFNREKEILGKNFLLTDKQKKWLDQKKQCMNIEPKVILDRNHGKCREFFLQLVESRKFDIFILICIILNTVVLAINWYSQPVYVDDILDFINYGFALVFAFESISKIIAFGAVMYFKKTENLFDFFIVVVSLVSSIVSLVLNVDFGASTTFIRALRITRIFKYIKKSKQIKVIFETLIVTIPALTNIGGLLLLFLYIYSVLGVFLFAEVMLQDNLNVQANFQSFGRAFLTLLRCSTGEAWDYIMMDTTRQKTILFQCTDEDFDFQNYVLNGYQTAGCGSGAGIVYFMSYFLMCPLIFLNLFIAIILEGFEQTNHRLNSLLPEEYIERFRDCWANFDKNGTGFIKITDLNELMFQLEEPLGWNDRYRDDIEYQDNYMEELNIPTYNLFKEYQFYDVIQALTKVYMVQVELKQQLDLDDDDESFEVTDEDLYRTENSYGDDDAYDTYNQQAIEQQPNQTVPEAQDMNRVEGQANMNPAVSSTLPPLQSGRKRKSEITIPNVEPSATSGSLHKVKTLRRKKTQQVDQELKIQLRLELEFESIDNQRKQVMDVEEIKLKEDRLRKSFKSQQDMTYTSAHIKAARKILNALRRRQEKRLRTQVGEGASIGLLSHSPYKHQRTSQKSIASSYKKRSGMMTGMGQPPQRKERRMPSRKMLSQKHNSYMQSPKLDSGASGHLSPHGDISHRDNGSHAAHSARIIKDEIPPPSFTMAPLQTQQQIQTQTHKMRERGLARSGLSGVIKEYEELENRVNDHGLEEEELKADIVWENEVPSNLQQQSNPPMIPQAFDFHPRLMSPAESMIRHHRHNHPTSHLPIVISALGTINDVQAPNADLAAMNQPDMAGIFQSQLSKRDLLKVKAQLRNNPKGNLGFVGLDSSSNGSSSRR